MIRLWVFLVAYGYTDLALNLIEAAHRYGVTLW